MRLNPNLQIKMCRRNVRIWMQKWCDREERKRDVHVSTLSAYQSGQAVYGPKTAAKLLALPESWLL